jgi:RNA polymerase sigma-54 factor
LIAEEAPGKPLSDSRIARLLEREGIKIARRTVAKYRESLGLAASSERRKMAALQPIK